MKGFYNYWSQGQIFTRNRTILFIYCDVVYLMLWHASIFRFMVKMYFNPYLFDPISAHLKDKLLCYVRNLDEGFYPARDLLPII